MVILVMRLPQQLHCSIDLDHCCPRHAWPEERHRELSDAARQSPCHRDRRAASALGTFFVASQQAQTFQYRRGKGLVSGAHADIGEDKTAGGIIIPDSAKEKPSEGEILSV